MLRMARGEHQGFVPATGSRSQDAPLLPTPLPPQSFGLKQRQGHSSACRAGAQLCRHLHPAGQAGSLPGALAVLLRAVAKLCTGPAHSSVVFWFYLHKNVPRKCILDLNMLFRAKVGLYFYSLKVYTFCLSNVLQIEFQAYFTYINEVCLIF